jgi:PqqD family protein of HPr-rel-A system
MAARKPKVRDDLTVVELDGEAVVYDEASNRLHHLNPTATIIFNLCDGQSTIRELAEDISTAFEVDTREVEQQVRTMLREFRQQGFFPEPQPAGRQVRGRARARTNGSRSKPAKKR